MTFLNIIPRYLKNQKRNLARRIIRPWLKYFYDTSFVMGGNAERLVVGHRSALSNTLFNVSSGVITVGDRSIFGQGVIVTTGRHEFLNGRRVSFDPEYDDGSWGGGANEVPSSGFDINIGSGVFIASGSIILGGVSIGNHCIVAAGAVVTKSFPDYSFIAGVPARQIKSTRD
jgi:acetyltransferase-like isoleucine patch superfamily enzyme